MRLKILLLLLLFFAMALGPAVAQSRTEKPPAGTAAADAGYVGNEVCVGCHEDQNKRFKNTVMGKTFSKPRTPLEAKGCESCHGPGAAHVEAGGGKDTIPIRFGKDSKLDAEAQNVPCLACHSRGKQLFWKGSAHEMRGMSCVGCHQVKAARKTSLLAETRFLDPLTRGDNLLTTTQTELCLDCHKMRKAQLQRSSHMPYREGKVTCSSCHNPHGSPNPKQLTEATVTENCLKCHAERRGPFLWEHPPVAENCDNCHEPHGSSNPQLLKIRQPRMCQSCHVTARHPAQPGAAVNLRIYNRSCTNCHVQIHGSNHPSGNMYVR